MKKNFFLLSFVGLLCFCLMKMASANSIEHSKHETPSSSSSTTNQIVDHNHHTSNDDNNLKLTSSSHLLNIAFEPNLNFEPNDLNEKNARDYSYDGTTTIIEDSQISPNNYGIFCLFA
jgi:hypothetical protein